jgi:hypothetical protein
MTLRHGVPSRIGEFIRQRANATSEELEEWE